MAKDASPQQAAEFTRQIQQIFAEHPDWRQQAYSANGTILRDMIKKTYGITYPEGYTLDPHGEVVKSGINKKQVAKGLAIAGAVMAGGLGLGALGVGAGATAGGTALGSAAIPTTVGIAPGAVGGAAVPALLPTSLAGTAGAAGGSALASTPFTAPGLAMPTGSAGVGMGAGAGSSTISNIVNGVKKYGPAAGRALGAASETMAQNRGSAIESLLASDTNRLNFDRNQRDSDSSLLKQMAQTAYVKGGGYQAPTSGYAASLPHYGFGPKPASPEQMAAANTLQGQLLERQKNPLKPTDISSFIKPGAGERLSGWVSPFLNYYGNK